MGKFVDKAVCVLLAGALVGFIPIFHHGYTQFMHKSFINTLSDLTYLYTSSTVLLLLLIYILKDPRSLKPVEKSPWK